MNRVVVIVILLFVIGLAACQKEDDGGLASYRAQAAKDDAFIASYLKANPSLVASKADTSGVYYIIENQGTGTNLFTNSTQVTIGDTARLITENGGTFTEAVFSQTANVHPSYVLAQTILGWRIGIPYVKQGGTIRLLVPSRYAFGPAAQPMLGQQFGLTNGLPANAVLDFTITLYNINNTSTN